MKLLLFPPYFTPEKQASSLLDEQRYQAFAESGIDMLLYTPIPTRGVSAEERNEYRMRREEQLFNGKMQVVRYPLMKEGRNPIGRAFRYCIGFLKQLFIGYRQKEVDCIFLVSTPPIQGVLGGILKKRLQVPFVYNLQDIFPDSLVGTGLAKKGGLLWKVGRKIEDYSYSSADKIIVISEDFKRNIMSKGVPEEKIEVVYNWVDQNIVVPIVKERNPLFDEFNISREKFHVLYAGNLGYAQNIDVIIDSAKIMSDETDIEFLVFGTGGMKDYYLDKVKSYGIDNVKFFPLQSFERVPFVYGLGDVCIVSCKPGLGGAAMPSKMLSIMSAGRAVVASFDDGELSTILNDYRCGMCAPAGDVDAFVDILRTMAANRNLCAEMGLNARQLVLNRFTSETCTQKYVQIIRNVVKN